MFGPPNKITRIIVVSGLPLHRRSLYRGYRNIEDRYIEVLSHTFYYNFCRDIEFSLLYRGISLYRGSL